MTDRTISPDEIQSILDAPTHEGMQRLAHHLGPFVDDVSIAAEVRADSERERRQANLNILEAARAMPMAELDGVENILNATPTPKDTP